MPYSFRRASLQRVAKVVDLAIIALASLTALVISSGSFTWPTLAHLFVIRIKIMNLFLLVGYLAFCSLVFSMHSFYSSERFLERKERTGRILSAVTFITGA